MHGQSMHIAEVETRELGSTKVSINSAAADRDKCFQA